MRSAMAARVARARLPRRRSQSKCFFVQPSRRLAQPQRQLPPAFVQIDKLLKRCGHVGSLQVPAAADPLRDVLRNIP